MSRKHPGNAVYRILFDDGEEMVLRAHSLPSARVLAYSARAERGERAPRIVDVTWKPLDAETVTQISVRPYEAFEYDRAHRAKNGEGVLE